MSNIRSRIVPPGQSRSTQLNPASSQSLASDGRHDLARQTQSSSFHNLNSSSSNSQTNTASMQSTQSSGALRYPTACSDSGDIVVDGTVEEDGADSDNDEVDAFPRHAVCSELDNGTPRAGSNKDLLVKENEELKKTMLCRKCRREKVQTLFLPCRHLVTCEPCADTMDNCLLCDQTILGTVRTFFG